jgi:hypothetical protein
MGGGGSGRIKSRDRELIENCDSLDIAFISRYGLTIFPVYASIETDSDRPLLLIDYNTSIIGPKFEFIDRFELTKTNPHFGGQRYWIICNECGKRVRKLFRPDFERLFKCRHCYPYLMYQSQESNVYDGWLRKAAIGNGMSPRQYEMTFFG